MARRQRQPRAEAMGAALERMLRRSGLFDGVREHRALALWPRVVGPALASVTEPLGLRQGTLRVRVDGATWRAELHHLLPVILERLNAELDRPLLAITLVTGPVPRAVAPRPPLPPPRDPASSVEEAVARAREASRRRR